jgi:hypothetical protein
MDFRRASDPVFAFPLDELELCAWKDNAPNCLLHREGFLISKDHPFENKNCGLFFVAQLRIFPEANKTYMKQP